MFRSRKEPKKKSSRNLRSVQNLLGPRNAKIRLGRHSDLSYLARKKYESAS